MSTMLSPSDMLDAVRSTAMLADVSISVWSANKSDAALMENIKADAGATGKVGHVVKNILAGGDELLKDCQGAHAAVRTAHYSLTLPWVSDPHAERARGPRLLPNMLFDKYLTTMSERRRAAMAALDAFVADYPDAIRRARIRLGKLAPTEYPSEDFVRRSFRVSFEWEPIPSGAAFKNLPDNVLGKLANTLEKRQTAMIEASQTAMWKEVRERVQKLAEKTAEPDARFKFTTVENVRELIEVMPGWNITQHPAVAEIVEDIEHMLRGIDAKDIRKDTGARADIAIQAAKVIEKMDGWRL